MDRRKVEQWVGGGDNLRLIIALVISMALFQALRSLVRDVIMPIFTLGSPYGGWEVSTLQIGPIAIGWGILLADMLTLAGILWLVAEFLQ